MRYREHRRRLCGLRLANQLGVEPLHKLGGIGCRGITRRQHEHNHAAFAKRSQLIGPAADVLVACQHDPAAFPCFFQPNGIRRVLRKMFGKRDEGCAQFGKRVAQPVTPDGYVDEKRWRVRRYDAVRSGALLRSLFRQRRSLSPFPSWSHQRGSGQRLCLCESQRWKAPGAQMRGAGR